MPTINRVYRTSFNRVPQALVPEHNSLWAFMKNSYLVACKFLLLAGLWLGASSALHAQPYGEPLFNVFSISSDARADVENDLMIATLYVQEEDDDASALASKINVTMKWALDALKTYPSLKVKTRDYQTYPRYDTSQARRLIGWRATQSVQVETDDFQSAGKAIQQLQEKLKVQGIRLAVKPATRAAAADALISEALEAFRKRATLVQQNMGSTGYKVVDVHINADQNPMPMFDSRARHAETLRSAAVAQAPAIEAGTSQVSVQVSGRIQLE